MTRRLTRSHAASCALVVMILTAPLAAHPASTFGVRLNVSSGVATVIINADAQPLLLKLDALAGVPASPAEAVARVQAHESLIRSLSLVSADGAPLTLTPQPPHINADGQIEITLVAALPSGARHVTWQSRLIYGTYPLSVSHGANPVESVFWLESTETSAQLPAVGAVGGRAALGTYLALGFEHILPKGLDHILFVLGLFLLTPRVRPLLAQVTTFTVAHSVSLALAMFGLVSVPSSVVEPLIALSIVYVGIENLLQRDLTTRRLWLVGMFGLLHGLGFAGVLTDISLPEQQWLTALAGFNLGVEAGQLAVLAMAGIAWHTWSRWISDVEVWPRRSVSAGIAVMGAFWTITRLHSAFP